MMKHKINLLLLVAGVFFIFTSKADQLTITFTNPAPAAPVNCGDTWSEQGVEMEITISDYDNCNFDYGNGNLNLDCGELKLDLSELGTINTISTSYLYVCCTYFKYYNGNNLTYSEFVGEYNNGVLIIREFVNENNDLIDSMTINSLCDGGGTVLDITIDYTPICESEPISNVRNGDVYLDDACYGVIMTSPSGNCFRAKVADNGMLFTEPVECP